MEKKQFETPEVKVAEIKPRSIVAQSECDHEGCPTDISCHEDVCVHVQCPVYCSEY